MCRFCEEYEVLKNSDKESVRGLNNNPNRNFDHKWVMEAALVSIGKRKEIGGWKWIDNGRTTYYGYKLKFCPTCGRKL